MRCSRPMHGSCSKAIRALGRSVTDLKRIAITHGHRSHLGGLAALKRASGATVCAHAWEADIVGGDRRAQPVTVLPRQSLKLFPFQLGLRFNRPRHDPCPVDETLDDDDAFGPLQVLHAPGHSPGHLAFFWPERGFLIAGDAIATWPSLCAGWTAFNLNPKQHAASRPPNGGPRCPRRRRRPRRADHRGCGRPRQWPGGLAQAVPLLPACGSPAVSSAGR